MISTSEDVYGELLQWQAQLHSKSAGAVHNFLDSNLDQIAKVLFISYLLLLYTIINIFLS